MNYSNLIKLYKNNEFREIDKDVNAKKFYLLRSLSKSATLKSFCSFCKVSPDLDVVLDSKEISCEKITNYIRQNFTPKTDEEIKKIEAELNKLQNFDWGGSAGNSLEKNLVNNVIKRFSRYDDVIEALAGPVQRSVYGYTLNSWYNHWSSIMIEDIFNANPNVIPTIDLVEKIDFYINDIPFDLKVTYFPEELMKSVIGDTLKETFGKKSELACTKDVCKKLNIAIPQDLEDRALLICLQGLLRDNIQKPEASDFLSKLAKIKNNVYQSYLDDPNKLIVWLYENQGEMRFDAANRFYVVLIDRENPHESWKLKRNRNLLKDRINEKVNSFDKNKLNKVEFYWFKNEKKYECYSELLFIYK